MKCAHTEIRAILIPLSVYLFNVNNYYVSLYKTVCKLGTVEAKNHFQITEKHKYKLAKRIIHNDNL